MKAQRFLEKMDDSTMSKLVYYQLVITNDVDDYKRRGESVVYKPTLNRENCLKLLYNKLVEEINDYGMDIKTKDTNPSNEEDLEILYQKVAKGEFVPWRFTYEIFTWEF